MAGELHLTELATILRRRLRLIIAITVAGTAVTLLASASISARYTAKAQLLFEPQLIDAESVKAVIGASAEEAMFQSHITALTSRAFLSRVFVSLHDATARDTASTVYETNSPKGGAHGSEPGARTPGGDPGIATPVPSDDEEARLNRFVAQLRVYQEGTSHVIAITFTATEPAEAARAANKIAEDYIASDRDRKGAEVSRLVHWLDERLPQAKVAFDKAELSREATAAGQIYATLLQRREYLRARHEMVRSDLHVLSRASVPVQRSSPGPLLLVPPSLIICLLGGCFLAVVREKLDDRLHSSKEVVDELGIPCIGFIPLTNSERALHFELLLKNSSGPYAEAIRALAPMLLGAAAQQRGEAMLFSGSIPGEGTTALAWSFAAYAAVTGQRVLLLDFGCRHPAAGNQVQYFPVSSRLEARPSGGEFAKAGVQRFSNFNLDYLPIDSRSEEPLLPFSAGKMQRFLDDFRDRYDCIVIDAPAILAFAETRLLARYADKVVLAIKWNTTPRGVVRDALGVIRELTELNDETPKRVTAVLTQVDLREHVAHRYQGWESTHHLHAMDEAKPAAKARWWDLGLDHLRRPRYVASSHGWINWLRDWAEGKRA